MFTVEPSLGSQLLGLAVLGVVLVLAYFLFVPRCRR